MMSFGDTSRRQWVLDEAAAEPIVRRAIEGGITFFDTADMYAAGASEVVTGRILPKLISRDEAVVATKVYYPTTAGPNGGGLSRKHVLAAIDASLARLQMDYVDLYQIHRWDPETPIEETMEALHDIVKAGKARYIGASTMGAWQFAKAQAVAERNGWTRFVSMQNHYNLLHREEEREMIPLCVDQGIAVVPYSPLARGFLARAATSQSDAGSARRDSDPVQGDLYGRDEDVAVLRGGRSVRRRHWACRLRRSPWPPHECPCCSGGCSRCWSRALPSRRAGGRSRRRRPAARRAAACGPRDTPRSHARRRRPGARARRRRS